MMMILARALTIVAVLLVRQTNAACTFNDYGRDIPNPNDPRITGGDTITCTESNRCEYSKIEGCKKVICEDYGCEYAEINANGVVGGDVQCNGMQACSSARIYGYSTINCTGTAACARTDFAGGQVICNSPGELLFSGDTSAPCRGVFGAWGLDFEPDCVQCLNDDSCFGLRSGLGDYSYDLPLASSLTLSPAGSSWGGNCVEEEEEEDSMDGTAGGDPHVKTWGGKWFDYDGQCDMILVQNPKLDLHIHIRTKARQEYSFIESAAIKIQEDILEVSSFGEYTLNGVDSPGLPFLLADKFLLTHKQISKKRHTFQIELSNQQHITINTMKDMVTVNVMNATAVDFEGSVGLMGRFSRHGHAVLGRDGTTDMENDWNAYGQEWQVRDTELQLFSNQDTYPQYPQPCVLLNPKSQSRRLGAGSVSQSAAEEACARWTGAAKEKCVYDVLATEELDAAEAFGAY